MISADGTPVAPDRLMTLSADARNPLVKVVYIQLQSEEIKDHRALWKNITNNLGFLKRKRLKETDIEE